MGKIGFSRSRKLSLQLPPALRADRFKLGSKNKAKVAIANRIARSVYKILCRENYKEIGYIRGDPHEAKVRKHVSALKALGVNVFHHNH